jgi:hypothetical protein
LVVFVVVVVLVVAVVPVVPVVAVVAVVADVSVLAAVAVVAEVSVVDETVPVVAEVSVEDVALETDVSVVADVSVFALSSFLQPTARMAIAKMAIRVRTNDFFMCSSPLKFQIVKICLFTQFSSHETVLLVGVPESPRLRVWPTKMCSS